jgi:hypothetical protein
MRQIDGNCKCTENIKDGVQLGYTFHTCCPSCQAIKDVSVQPYDLFKYRNGVYIHDAFPYLSRMEREALMTGFCDSCWNENIVGNRVLKMSFKERLFNRVLIRYYGLRLKLHAMKCKLLRIDIS